MTKTISRRTLTAIREYLTGWTLREISDEFEAAGIIKDDSFVPNVSGERRRLVEQYYHSLDLTDPQDLRPMVRAFEYILATAYQKASAREDYDALTKVLDDILQRLASDGFSYQEGRLIPTEPALRLALRSADNTRTISEVTRRSIFDWLRINRIEWSGVLDEVEFLDRLYDLDALPSTDSRYVDARGDILTHRVSFPNDWPFDWVFTDDRLDLLNGPDETLLAFVCEMVHPVVRRQDEVEKLVLGVNTFLRQDGWELVEQSSISGRPVFAARRQLLFDYSDFTSAKAVAHELDPDYLTRQINRMESTVKQDPEAAIGFAKEFIETVCKTILDNRQVPYTKSDDLPRLSKKVCQSTRLLPEGTAEETRGTEMTQRFIANLGSLVQGLAEIRGTYGTGHGKGVGFVGLGSDHARLAVSCATALGVFLVQCHQADSKAADRQDAEGI